MSKINGHEQRINTALAVAYQREGREAIITTTPQTFAEMFEEPDDSEEIRNAVEERAHRIWEWVFQDGPHPGCVLRRLYLLVQHQAPDLMLNMNGAELADMFGETRAAWSARNKRIFSGYLAARGAKATRGWMQKSAATSAKYAASARHNTNRRGKFKKAA